MEPTGKEEIMAATDQTRLDVQSSKIMFSYVPIQFLFFFFINLEPGECSSKNCAVVLNRARIEGS